MTFLTRLSLSNRKIVAVLALAIITLGIAVAPTLKQQLYPDLSFPTVSVIATYQGASPSVVEEQVTKPLEQAIDAVDGLTTITSTSQQGAATLQAQFDYGSDVDDEKTAIQNAIAGVTSLPESVTTSVVAGSTDDQATLTLAATSKGSLLSLAQGLEDDVVPKIKAVEGVNDVTVTGERDQQVVITPDTDKLEDNGLTTSSISTAITGENGANSAGAITSDGKALSVDVGSSITSVEQIQNLWLSGSTTSTTSSAVPSGVAGQQAGAATTQTTTKSKQVQLKDVATVKLEDSEATSITRTDGQDSLGVSVTMAQGGSAATISSGVRDQLTALERSLPDDAELTVISDNGPSVSESINGLLEEGLLGLIMAVLVILLFLRSLRSTLVTAISIPASLLIAIVALWARDYSLNIFTVGGLTMAVGRVVDDSIVVLENIKRHLSYGEERHKAIIDGVREVAGAVTSSTLTTVAVFVPIALVSGIVGQLFGPFALTVAAAMIASLIVSLTVVPTFAYWFLKGATVPQGTDPAVYRLQVQDSERHGVLQRAYRPVIGWTLRFRKTVVGLAVLLLIATLAVAGGLKTSFLGSSEQTSLSVSQTLPVGTALSTTNEAAQSIEQQIEAVHGVATYQVVIGGSGSPFGGASNTNTASYTINLASDADADTVQSALRKRIAKLDDVGDVTFGASGVGGGSSTIDVTLNASSTGALTTATDRIVRALQKVDSVSDVNSSLQANVEAISVKGKGEATAKAGLSDSSLATAVAEAVSGSTVSQVTIDGSTDDVVLQSSTDPTSLEAIAALKVTNASGDQVRLDSVATVERTSNPTELTRIDGKRANTISATPRGDNTGAASAKVTTALAKVKLPSGVTYSLGGITSSQGEAFSQLALAILAAIALVVLILLAVFKSFRQTLILLVSIPFAFTGAVFLLRITDTPLGVAAIIGILMLIGIVVTNAIVLMDLVNQYRERGMSVVEAVVEGGSRRLRPILMTALATMIALVPMALGLTGSGIISTPLAIVVIGGLFTSTLLTLVLIPVLYTMVETRRERNEAKRAERRTVEMVRPVDG